jgi:DNA-binding NarL/FixJ family response regulator
MAPIRVIIADDQAIVRSGFAALLDTRDDITVVGTARDGEDAVAVATAHRPDVVLMDVRMPVVNGIEATRTITRTLDPPPRVVVLTTFDLDEYVYDALSAGASGFLLKDVTAETLFAAVRVVAAGDALLTPNVTRRLIDEFVRIRPQHTVDGIADRTAREVDVLRLIATGRSNAEIAAEIFVSNETVKTHVSRILAKLDARDRTQAVIAAYQSGLVQPGRL